MISGINQEGANGHLITDGTLLNSEGKRATSNSDMNFDPASQIIVQGLNGPYVMDKKKWPILSLPEEVALEGSSQEESLTQDCMVNQSSSLGSKTRGCVSLGDPEEELLHHYEAEDIMDTFSDWSKGSDKEEGDKEWQSPKLSKKKRKKKAKQVVVATRTSSRIPRDGRSITEKATSRVMAKNTITGITQKHANPFTVLNNADDAVLSQILGDLNVEVTNVGEQIGVFKAEELARAALAEANYKVFLEKQVDRDKPFSEDLSCELNMTIIDNKDRLEVVSKNDEGNGSFVNPTVSRKEDSGQPKGGLTSSLLMMEMRVRI